MSSLKKITVLFLILVTLLVIGCVEPTDSTQTTTKQASSGETDEVNPIPPQAQKDICKWDWKFGTTKHIGIYDAPAGYTYAVVTLYIKNEAHEKVSTNPYCWTLSANGIEYDSDVATYSDKIDHETVDVSKGGEFTTQFVYLVQDGVTTASLDYDGISEPEMELIDHFNTEA